MRNLIRNLQSYWLADASFVTLLIMLVAAVFVLPVIMEISGRGVLLFNILLLSVLFSGIFSTRSAALMSISAILFGIHLTLRLIRFGDSPYSFFVLENVVGIANAWVFIVINLRLLFRDEIVNAYRIVGAVNVAGVDLHWLPACGAIMAGPGRFTPPGAGSLRNDVRRPEPVASRCAGRRLRRAARAWPHTVRVCCAAARPADGTAGRVSRRRGSEADEGEAVD